MAIYFLNLKSLGRASGSSSVSAAAYRAGERIKDERTGRTYDHSGRQDVLHKEIMLPNQFAAENMAWAKDRSNLWNMAERVEARGVARTAREYLVALPPELSPQARINLVKGFSRELVERYGFALDIAIHAPRNYPGSDPRNFHAHLLATTREVTPTGLGAKTALEWSDTRRRQHGLGRAVGELLYVRERWAMAANAALEKEHVNARIDHRTLKAQGIDREPRPHIPHAAFEMERRGYHSAVAERIRADYQARVEARLARTAQHQQPVATQKSLAGKAKEYALKWLGVRPPQKEAQTRSPEVIAKDSVQRGLRDRQTHEVARPSANEDLAKKSTLSWAARYGQAYEKNPRDVAKQAALRWKAQYGQAHEKSSEDRAMEAALRWKAKYGQTHEKSSEDRAMEAALKWKAKYDQAHHKSPEEMAQESAMRWHRSRQAQLQEQAQGKAPARKLAQEREHGLEQNGPAPASASRSRDYDLSL
jgi:MobA/MobL family